MAKKTKVEVYDVDKDGVERKASDGFIKKHPWYTMLGAAVVGTVLARVFWRRKP